eukprot:CAMPEP_0202979486 /NCGR_PEP_ID=MMETSP1396-20130829/85614_1 /ASSEMBLY_ACC=CAM_ASM_000872 /TAXON_ID= /ORGANISM="Pseudokeronopsis sp., Strain Brazil" /LENGTH=175 /DNA_ID=CAMNT_0049718915 /DNA_START=456 /DNA_END=983 /DNA_ORIENTATION=+
MILIFDTDDSKVKQFLKTVKKALSLVGFSFHFDVMDGKALWFESGVQGAGGVGQKQVDKLIGGVAICDMLGRLVDVEVGAFVNIAVANIIRALQRHKEMNDQVLIDHLLFLQLKLGFSNVLDMKVVADPLERKKQGLNTMMNSLRILLRNHYGIDEQKLQLDQYFINHEYAAFNM